MPGSLVFGANTSDRVDFGSPAALDNLNTFTYLAWVYPTTLTDTRLIMTKGTTSLARLLRLVGTAGNIGFFINRPTNTVYTTDTTPLSATSTWIFIAGTFDSAGAAGQVCNIYKGTLAALAAESTYGTATDGSGAVDDDSAEPFLAGNGGGLTLAFQGRIAACAVFSVVLSLANVQSWQRRPRKTVGANTAVLFARFGKYGADAIEYTGLTGTVTGATQGNGAPLWQGDASNAPALATVGG